MWRLGALTMAAVLGFSTIFSGNSVEHRVFAENEETETIKFAEGDGTGKDFTEASWVFAGLDKDKKDVTQAGEGKAPGIETDNKYLKNNKKVIRLINGVKAQSDRSTGLEDMTGASYDIYRSGEAFLSKGIQMKKDTEFSAKFTFSMPEAVVNTDQTKGNEGDGRPYAREVGGDGIAFVMTTNSTHDTQAGSGIGYQGIDNSIAVELDSFFNGAYYMPGGQVGKYSYENWDFDNQLFFHAGVNNADGAYLAHGNDKDENYVNPNFAERFDHVAITKDGDVKTHLAKYYMNGLDPTKLVDGEYVNLANRYKNTNTTSDKNLPRKTGSTDESNSPTCATRFADKGVDTRLFTVWIDYEDNTMNVSIANGDYANAVKPAVPQITNTVNLDNFDGQVVYMGFTSAIGSSKANHTIHAFSFSNAVEATYRLNYHKKNKKTGQYELVESSDVCTGNVGTTVTAEDLDPNYKERYKDDNYVYSETASQETSVELEDKGGFYEMNVYYDPAEAHYKLEYYKWDSNEKKYVHVLADDTNVFTDDVGTKVTVTDVDPNYTGKYPGWKVNDEYKEAVYNVELKEAGVTYVMKVYYDPIPPEEAGYVLNYYKKNPKTGQYEYIESSKEFSSELGKTYHPEDVDKDYKTKYENDGYVYNDAYTKSMGKDSVTLEEANRIYGMDVYYDPAEAYYLVNYYVYNSETKQYELKESTSKATGYVGENVQVTDVDPAYGSKYPGYSVNQEKNQDFAKKLEKAGETYEMNVYYDPDTAGYKLNYHKLNPNTGIYEYVESTKVFEGNVNKTYTVTDADADYETKYQKDHYVINPEKNETYSVLIAEENKTYEMNVYYDPVKTTYKTEYYVKESDGTYTLKDTVLGEETYAGKNVTAPEKSYEGYVHVTTPDSKESAVVEADGSTTMKVYFDPEKKPTYKVEYYVEQPDGSYKLYTEVKDIEADAGANVDAEIIEIPGYTHTTTPDTNESDVVLADSSTVLKVYYNLVIEPTIKPTIEPTVAPTKTPTEKPKPTKDPDTTLGDNGPQAPVSHTPESEAPQTGDSSRPGLYFALMLSSILVFILTFMTKTKKKEDDME